MSDQMPNYTAVEQSLHREELRRMLARLGDNDSITIASGSAAEFAIRAGCNALGQIGVMQEENQRLNHKIAQLENVAAAAEDRAKAAPYAGRVPDTLDPEFSLREYGQPPEWTEGWNACRAAMLDAQPVEPPADDRIPCVLPP